MRKVGVCGWAVLLSLSACCSNGTPKGNTGGASGGTGSTAGTGSGGTATGGAPGCGPSSFICGGACVVTSVDPDNCGACGHACPSGDVCVDGVCGAPSTCPQGTQACGNACADLQSGDANCGTCGHACPAGQGCSDGTCVPALVFDAGPGQCPNGGPPLYVDDAGPNGCTGNLAQITFRYALCSCADLGNNGLLYTDAFDSALGPYVDGGLGGAVGADGTITTNGDIEIGGACWSGGTSTLLINGPGAVGLDLHVNAQLTANSGLTVGTDAYVNGDVQAASTVDIGGTLYVPTGAQVSDSVTASQVVFGPVTVPPPCDCSAGQLIDVASIVTGGMASNDDAAIGLSPDVLVQTGGEVRIDLPCGRYGLDAITPNGGATIAVHGRVVIFVSGDIQSNGGLTFALDPSATLDVFVGGNLLTNGSATFGSTLVPAQFRLYVAGSQVTLNGSGLWAGNFYLPYASFIPNGELDLYGSLFAGSYQANGGTNIHYDGAILNAGAECSDGGTPVGGTGSTGGTGGGTGCTSCRDCQNQACINGTCGACQSDSDCCSPLTCVAGACGIQFH